jgi:flagellar protein FlaI
MVYRLENPPVNLPRILLSALKIVVLQSQVKIGKGTARRIRSIVEIVGIEPETNELITNTVYQWNSADDSFQFNGHSFMFERIMAMKNLTTAQMKEEFKRRVEIVEWMGKRNISHYHDVFKIVAGYYKDPDLTIKRVRTELYGKGPAATKT